MTATRLGVAILGALLLTSTVAVAGPFSGEGTSAREAAASSTNCADRLGNSVYACDFKRNDGFTFAASLTFSQSPFTLTVESLGFSLTCTCATIGPFNHPDFLASKTRWVCVGSGDFAAVFEGDVGGHGKISKVTAANNTTPDTFVASCTRQAF